MEWGGGGGGGGRGVITRQKGFSENGYLTIIPRAQMGSESIAHEAESWMGYWLRGHEGERNNNIVLVKSN